MGCVAAFADLELVHKSIFWIDAFTQLGEDG